MFARFSRSWSLVKSSASVLRQDKELLVFPLISVVAVMFVVAAFALPAFGLGALDGLRGGGDKTISAAMYAVAFLFYFCQYLVIFFFNVALVGAAMMRLDGKDPTVADGLRIATSRIGAIAGYAAIAATVGMILRALQERVGFIGKIVVALVGVGWTVATFLVVPVLVSRDVGPIEAVKESAGLLRKSWGENLIGQGGLGLAFALIYLAVVIAAMAWIALAIAAKSVALVATAILLAVIAVAVAGLIHAALSGIYSAALYRYATTGEQSPGFDANALQLAFAPK